MEGLENEEPEDEMPSIGKTVSTRRWKEMEVDLLALMMQLNQSKGLVLPHLLALVELDASTRENKIQCRVKAIIQC